MKTSQRGFTIPELIIMMAVTSILTLLVISFMMYYWAGAARLQNDSATLVSRLNAGDALRDALNVSSGLITQNSIQDPYASVVDPSAGSGYWLQQHATPKTITMPSGSSVSPVFYFQAPSVTTARTFIMNGTQSYKDEFILFLDGSTKTLKLRNLINTSAAGDRLKRTCPPASATPTCPTDRILSENVASVTTRYFSRSGNTVDYTSIVQKDSSGNPVVPTVYIGPDFPSVEVVELTIRLYQKASVGGATNTANQVIVRVALRNG